MTSSPTPRPFRDEEMFYGVAAPSWVTDTGFIEVLKAEAENTATDRDRALFLVAADRVSALRAERTETQIANERGDAWRETVKEDTLTIESLRAELAAERTENERRIEQIFAVGEQLHECSHALERERATSQQLRTALADVMERQRIFDGSGGHVEHCHGGHVHPAKLCDGCEVNYDALEVARENAERVLAVESPQARDTPT